MKLPFKSLFALLSLVTFAFVAQVQVANAEPENPIVRGSLTVSVIGGGKVTGTGIDCGADCSHDASWRDNEVPPVNRLTATANLGWAFNSWSGCTPISGGRCDAGYGIEEPNRVTARFIDVMAPSVFISSVSPGEVAGDSVLVGVSATDNDRVTKVEYLIDGNVVATLNSALWSANLNLGLVPEGVHQIQARAYDPAGNNGITVNYPITVDHTGPDITLNSPIAATNAATVSFSFSSEAGDLHSAVCSIQREFSDFEPSPCARDEWFTGDVPTEGKWDFVVQARDNAGNFTSERHSFVVDRAAPVAEFTSGPADGSVLEVGNVKFEWSATDGLPLTQKCSWDDGETIDCDGSATRGVTAGAHKFKVEITDQAGNETTLSRTFSVRKDGNIPDPDPQADKTAPVVKIVAPKQSLRSMRKALRLNVRCNEACTGRVVVTARGGLRFAARVVLPKAGVAKLRIRPTSKVRKRLAIGLRKVRKPLVLNARANLRDKAGNAGAAKLRFKVRK